MGRSAKMTKRFSKADREAKKINAQSAPAPAHLRSPSPENSAATAPLAIPLFNTSVPGRIGKQPSRSVAQPAAKDGDMLVDAGDQDSDGLEPALESERSAASQQVQPKKKGGLRDKARAAKKAIQAEQDKSNDKLTGAQKRKGKKQNVLGAVDYVKLHEARPGKKKFR